MTFVISKDFTFAASHQLDGLPADHPCSRLHGHNIVVRVELAAAGTDSVGFVVDYRRMAPIGDWLDERFDHQHLNDRVAFNPTAEHMARYIYEYIELHHPEFPVHRVGWSETPKTWAFYDPSTVVAKRG